MGAGFAALWTPDTWYKTAATLSVGGMLKGVAASPAGYWIATAGFHKAQHGVNHMHFEVIVRSFKGGVYKFIMPCNGKLAKFIRPHR